MKKSIDKIFITNIPSFYKIKLYNELNKRISIFVVFLFSNNAHRNNEVRNGDFFDEEIKFPCVFMPECNSFFMTFKLIKIIHQYDYKEMIIGGWSYLQYFLPLFFSKVKKNSASIESSIFESKINGVQGLIKKIFLSRISKVYVPGQSNLELLQSLRYKKKVVKTYGVGLYNLVEGKKSSIQKNKVTKFLYVGRLSSEKNLFWLIEQFNLLPEYELTIVGFGPLETELKKIAKDNIVFVGAVSNKEIYKYYQDNDVFVLPSLSETWGLVVEEALNNGLPVLVSNRVGCAKEIVHEGKNGFVFGMNNENDFIQKINQISDDEVYRKMTEYIQKIDFDLIEEKQIKAYL